MGFTNDMPADEAWTFEKVSGGKRRHSDAVCVERIRDAAMTIADYIKKTPTLREYHLSERFGTNFYLKHEILQYTGAFKVRGAFNKMLSLTLRERKRGVVAVSGGNHAQAVAFAARRLGIKALTLMPEFTPENYVRETLRLGAEVRKFRTLTDAFAAADKYVEKGMTMIHPFDDAHVVCGQGTIGFEILRDVPNVTDVIVSIGGGGLAAGISTVLKSIRPEINIWGVETKGADSMSKALDAGKPFDIGEMTSIARTLGATRVGKIPFEVVRKTLADVLVVDDAEAVRELFLLLDKSKILTEPAASCTLAAAERLKDEFGPERHVVAVLCGGNLAIEDLLNLREEYPFDLRVAAAV